MLLYSWKQMWSMTVNIGDVKKKEKKKISVTKGQVVKWSPTQVTELFENMSWGADQLVDWQRDSWLTGWVTDVQVKLLLVSSHTNDDIVQAGRVIKREGGKVKRREKKKSKQWWSNDWWIKRKKGMQLEVECSFRLLCMRLKTGNDNMEEECPMRLESGPFCSILIVM